MGDRCTGRCCRSFPLPESYEDLRVHYEAHQQGGLGRTFAYDEIEKIYPMLIPLGTVRESGWHEYTCRHHDAATGDCLNYENRPGMCADYPYGDPCVHGAACEFDAARNGEWPPNWANGRPIKRLPVVTG